MLLPALALLAGCSRTAAAPAGEGIVAVPAPESASVLVVVNSASRDSMAVGSYYVKRRGIPYTNVVTIEVPDEEEISREQYRAKIENPVVNALMGKNIDYIVTTKGVPIRIKEMGWSVDAFLMTLDADFMPLGAANPDAIRKNINPFFGKKEAFSHNATRLYLTCRLDGYTLEDCKALVDRSIAAKPLDGPFLFDMADNRREGGFGELQRSLPRAADVVKAMGKTAILDDAKPFIVPAEELAGYTSWGSNDNAFNLAGYRKLRFAPGALAETFVSTSGRTFRPTEGGQSLIADLVAQGVTGVKGYVSEPFVFALARPEIMFERYLSGSNLAESFYAASPVVKWKDVVIGDPLCRPYRK